MNTPVWTQIVTLLRPCGDRSVGLAGRQCHCLMTQNVFVGCVWKSKFGVRKTDQGCEFV